MAVLPNSTTKSIFLCVVITDTAIELSPARLYKLNPFFLLKSTNKYRWQRFNIRTTPVTLLIDRSV